MSRHNLVYNEVTGKFEAGDFGVGTTNPFVSESGTATLTNKTLTSPTLTGVAITGTSTIGAGMTLTAPAITGAATVAVGATITQPVVVVLNEAPITTNILTAAESGKTFFLSLAVGFASTLPAPAAGLFYRFIVAISPTGGAGYTIATNAAAQVIHGAAFSSTGGDADSTAGAGDPATTITFVNDAALMGDRVDVVSDGTNWYAQAFTNADGGVTFTG